MQRSSDRDRLGSSHTGGGHPTPDASVVYVGNPHFNGFDHKSIRARFVVKVYSILAVQLLVTVAMIGWFVLHQPTKEYFMQTGAPWLYAALGVGTVVYLVLICVESSRRSFPINFVLLALLTLSWGLVAAVMSARYSTITVMCAAGTTAFSTVVIMLLAKYAPFDITTCGCGLCVLALIHLIVSLVLTLVLGSMGYAGTAALIVAGLGAFLLSLYMLFDLQLIMGGRSAELSPEEYILAAALLYIDIIQLFQYMLILFGSND